MSFQEKNIIVTLVNFSLILIFYLFRVFQMVLGDGLNSAELFTVWGIVIVFAIVVTIAATILTQIVSAIIEAIRTGDENPEFEEFSDERDELIDLKGTKLTYAVSSLGVFIAMLSFVLGQQAIVMFSLLIFFGISAQIVGDVKRLYLYRRGF